MKQTLYNRFHSTIGPTCSRRQTTNPDSIRPDQTPWVTVTLVRGQTTIFIACLSFLLMCFSSCKDQAASGNYQRQLLIYCGITMTKPMEEIKGLIEQEHQCEIIMTTGGSGNLLRAIKHNKVGDLFLPGSDSYIKACQKEGLVTDTAHVGFNKAAMMVQKNNPKAIVPGLTSLTNKDYYIAICNPDSGSIGRETAKILERAGLFQEVQENARVFTTDSKKLMQLLRDKQTDIVINWNAVGTWEPHCQMVDILPIDKKYVQPKRLVIGMLKTCNNPAIAQAFMNLASGKKGRAIFEKFGLYAVE